MNSKRIVTAKSVEEMNCAVLEQFNLGKGEFLLQYYDETFEEWIDIPCDYIPSDKEKNHASTNSRIQHQQGRKYSLVFSFMIMYILCSSCTCKFF